MKLFGTILLASTIYFKGQAAEETKTLEATHRVVITTDYLDRLVAEALSHNVSLQAAGSRLRAAVLNAEAVRTWEDPTAFFGGSVYSEKGFNPSEEGNLAYGIEQKLRSGAGRP